MGRLIIVSNRVPAPRERNQPAGGLAVGLKDALREVADGWVVSDPRFHVQEAKMAWGIRPAGIDKGHAVRDLMKAAPFAGRYPVFIGDDVTDEDGIRAAVALGGIGLRIPRDFSDPAAVRAWLGALACGGADTWGA